MTRDKFIKKWLGNTDYKYCEENREAMRDDLDLVIDNAIKNHSDLSDVSVLLRKYMEQVISCEGISFIPSVAGERMYDQPVFTQEEVDYLSKLHDELSDC